MLLQGVALGGLKAIWPCVFWDEDWETSIIQGSLFLSVGVNKKTGFSCIGISKKSNSSAEVWMEPQYSKGDNFEGYLDYDVWWSFLCCNKVFLFSDWNKGSLNSDFFFLWRMLINHGLLLVPFYHPSWLFSFWSVFLWTENNIIG